MKYLEYAVRDLTKCMTDENLAPHATTTLLFMSVDQSNQAVKGLQRSHKYLEELTGRL